jgi:hypothetical protein
MTTTATTHPSFYLESSLPLNVTIDQYRRSRPRRAGRWQRLKQLAGGPGVVSASPA